jgi:hypothetical protein
MSIYEIAKDPSSCLLLLSTPGNLKYRLPKAESSEGRIQLISPSSLKASAALQLPG